VTGDILLLGCVHEDPDKRRRIAAALEREQPAAITVEVGATITRQEIAAAMRSWHEPLRHPKRYQLNAAGVATYRHSVENMMFQEYRAPLAFATEHKLPFEQIDHPGHGRITTLLQNENLAAFNHPHILAVNRRNVRVYYMRRKCSMESPHEESISASDLEPLRIKDFHINRGAELRDSHPAACLLDLRSRIRGTIVHVCGATHLVRDSQRETLYSLLEGNVAVRRALLADYAPDGYKQV
jgi:hypothetical protein